MVRWALRLGLGVVTTAILALGLGEFVIRVFEIPPRVVTIRTDNPGVRVFELEGQTVWEQLERKGPEGSRPTRRNLDCEGRRVLLLGDSIFFGSGLDVEQSLGVRLQEQLGDRSDGPWCVMNLAVPGSTLLPQVAFLKHYAPQVPPDVLVIELFYGSPRVPVHLGDTVYYLDALDTDGEGYPTTAWGLSGPVHRALFRNSRFWEYLTVTLNPGCSSSKACEPDWDAALAGPLAEAVALGRSLGATVLLAAAPPLDRPFEDQLADPEPWFDAAIPWAAANDLPLVRLESLLLGTAVEDVRLDPCCHYNASGTSELASRMAPWLAPALDARTPATAPRTPEAGEEAGLP